MAESVPNRANDPKRKLSISEEMRKLPVTPGQPMSNDVQEYMDNNGVNSLDDLKDTLYTCPSCKKTAIEEYSNMQATPSSSPGQATDSRNEEYPDACPCCGDCHSSHPEDESGNKICPIVDGPAK